MLESIFEEVGSVYRAKTKLAFLADIQGQIYDDDQIQELMENRQRETKQITVTFDRRWNDGNFSYSHADLLLVLLDRISGGTGITKPLSQVRVIHSHWTRSQLLRILRYFARNNREIRFRRILLLPYPPTIVGHKLDPAIYKK